MRGGPGATIFVPMHLPRALRLLGYALCAVTAGPEVIGWLTHRASPHGPLWIVCYIVFVLAFHVGASSPPRGRARRWAALGAQELAVIALALASPCQFTALALVVIALQAPLLMRNALVVAGLLGQTLLVSAIVMRGCGAWDSLSWLLAVSGFQAAVAALVRVALRESDAREELVRANAELHAARALLADATRADERARVSRELHDVLGHSLTALGLQLEVARNVGRDEAIEHVAKAQALAGEALAGVRFAVSAMRATAGADVGRALRELCKEAPGLVVHLEMPDPFRVDCSARAHCLVRCVQELLTNTLRHAQADNLWITIRLAAEGITVEARDDGRGAPRLSTGNGLAGMRARLEEMGGRLAIAATPNFSLEAHLPLERPA